MVLIWWCSVAMPDARQAAGAQTIRPCHRAAPWMLSQSCVRLPLPLSSPAVEMPAAAVSAQVDPALVAWATAGTPAGALPAASTRVIEVHRLSTDFRAATHIVQRPLPAALPPGTVLIRRAYVGINASDVNYSGGRVGVSWLSGWHGCETCSPTLFTQGAGVCPGLPAPAVCGLAYTLSATSLLATAAGRYFGSTQAAQAKLPFPAGFEAVGIVAAAAPDVQVSAYCAVVEAVQ